MNAISEQCLGYLPETQSDLPGFIKLHRLNGARFRIGIHWSKDWLSRYCVFFCSAILFTVFVQRGVG